MKVKERMSVDVKTIQLDSNISEAFKLMKENNCRRLPVINHGKLMAMITLTDLNLATPSMATTLSIHELNYILARTLIKDILPPKPKLITIGPDNYIETAANIMRENKISALPVVDKGELVGIITETDLFDALIEILGVKKAHTRIDTFAPDGPGGLADITGIMAARGINILNTVLYYDEKLARYKVILRIEDLDYQEVADELIDHGYEIESIIVKQ
ncbi:MAG: histidine kinase [Firmicutes bacterium HGW-Firmicutes-15]|nr:MAG: histidine kinase [Firmicutes bacterium HGW-Firmicutes-15]